MTRFLIVRKFAEASRATSFTDLWGSLKNDQVADLCEILKLSTGRELGPQFTRATAEDWTAMAALIAKLGSAATRLNALLSGKDWDNTDEIGAVLKKVERDAEAPGHSSVDLAVVKYLNDKVRWYLAFGEEIETFGKFRLLGLGTVSAMPAPDGSAYDIFISYKTRLYAAQAARLAERLEALGYRLWFDQDVLNKMQNRPEVFEKEHLISILTNAVKHSRCTVIFEGIMHAVEILPGRTEEEALADRTVMKNARNDVVDWDWQGLEIAATQRGITIHPKVVTAFETRDGATIWTENFSYGNDEQLLASIVKALSLFDIIGVPH
jgi:hypothetical protein